MEVSTGDKLKGKLKEGFGKVTGNKEMKEEGKAVEKVEKHSEKMEKQNEKFAKEQNKQYEHAANAGISNPNDIGVTDKIIGSAKQGLGSLIGDKQMESEGKSVFKAEEAGQKADKRAEKVAEESHKVQKERMKSDI
eukprot:TRINITY_DN8169_c0_g1_i1.p1 TRINITY_DN8169_c0_g1~~TRINITY_DN8169_c0_g1_i1.p1  ORF type:complete len:151 (-),score=82.48 TRINITY_DN8169_c0_g1_i1:17-424(-)